MRGSARLFSFKGIEIRVHFTFLFLFLLVAYSFASEEVKHGGQALVGALKGIGFITFVFFCVISHELCHSLTARRYGIKVRDITLLPIGGIASLSGFPDDPRQELAISLAGPLFNFVLAFILGIPLLLYLGWERFWSGGSGFPDILAYAFWINVVLGVFNLLPAFPMDGGRVLRAFLARRMDYQRATHIAALFGQIFAFIFAVWGLRHNIILFFIGLFIYFGATQEEAAVQIRTILKRFRVKDILSRGIEVVSPNDNMASVLEIIFHHRQEDFPVLDEGELVGFLSRQEILVGLRSGSDKVVGDIMRRDFVAVSPQESLVEVQRKMQESGTKALPVVEEGKVAGLVTLEDISKIYLFMSSPK